MSKHINKKSRSNQTSHSLRNLFMLLMVKFMTLLSMILKFRVKLTGTKTQQTLISFLTKPLIRTKKSKILMKGCSKMIM